MGRGHEIHPVGSLGRVAGVPTSLTDVQRWVDLLPDHTRALLARGPLQNDCRCCCAFDEYWEPHRGYKSAVASYLAEFHHGEGPEAYLRCLIVYLCAGWNGRFRRSQKVMI